MKHFSIEQLRKIIIPVAKEELLPRFNKVEREHKADGSVITEADHVVQQRIAEQLAHHWPDTVFLGEEMATDEQARLLASDKPVWCLDPLDGTRNFTAGIPFFSISIALLDKGEVVLGLVYDPIRDECFAASRDEGASLNGQPLVVIESGLSLNKTTAIIDFKRLDGDLAIRLVTELPYASQRSFGSVALDWCWLAAGRSHIYLHGRSYIWDYAAGNFIFNIAGGYSCTLAGEPVFINELELRSSVAAVDKNLFDEWTGWLGLDINNKINKKE